MKTMFQIKHTRPNILSRNLFKIVPVVLVVLLLALAFSFLGGVRSLTLEILSPILKTGDHFYNGAGGILKNFADKDVLLEENQTLKDELVESRFATIDLESVKYENQKLREALKIKPEGEYVLAAVIARPPQVPLDSLFLDKGTADGLGKGSLVLAGDRILIGKVVEVSRSTSIVALNSLAEAVSYGFVARTSEPIEIKGVGGGSMQARVPIDFDIEIGDKIMVSHTFTYFMAVAGIIEEDKLSGFKDVLTSLPVDVSKINLVFVAPIIKE